MVLSRRLSRKLHPSASNTLNVVFSHLRDGDDVTEIIRWDPVVISYGNKLCLKLKSPHNYPEIRAKLRLLGRFLTLKTVKKKKKGY